MRQRESVMEDYQTWRVPVTICKGMLSASPRIVEIRRASRLQLRQDILCLKKHLPPAEVTGF